MKVKIPFLKRFEEPLRYGKKTWTSRTKQMAKIGDTFEAYGSTFQIDFVFKMPLGVVAMYSWEEEGVNSMTDFVQVWNMIHPRKKFGDDQDVFVHVFHKVGGQTV